MNKSVLAALLLMLTLSVTHAQNIKIGYINSLELLSMMPETKTADEKLQALAKDLEAQYREYIMEYQKLANQLQTDNAMSEIAREARMQDLSNLEQRITNFESSSQEKIQNKRNELYEPIISKATAVVKEVADANGYTYVLDSSNGTVIQAPESDNLLELVKKQLGI